MIGPGINLVMTVIGFGVSTMFIVFVCTRLVCARIHLHSSRRSSFPISARSDLSVLERGLHGREPVVVANFPTMKFRKDLFLASEDAQCTVCLAEYHSEDILRILPYCGHSFHVTCIDIWLQQHSTCPVCRISLRETSEMKPTMKPMFSSAIRSQHGAESFDIRCYNNMSSRHGLSCINIPTHVIDPVQENHYASDVDETLATENLSHLNEGHQITKDTGSKHVESPSNP